MREKSVIEKLRARGLLSVAEAIAKSHHCLMEEIFSRSRVTHVARARRALYAALHGKGLSMAEIGRLLDLDHTSIVHGLKKCANRS